MQSAQAARLVATNPDRYCPTPTGGEPDCAAIIAAVEACTGVKCDPIVAEVFKAQNAAVGGRL